MTRPFRYDSMGIFVRVFLGLVALVATGTLGYVECAERRIEATSPSP